MTIKTVFHWVMVSKTIKFDYTGGKYIQDFQIRGTNLPWTYECDADWIELTAGATSLIIVVNCIYDFNTRVGTVKVFDRFRNEIDLVVEQTGYYDLSVEMPSDIVLYHSYYDENDTYNVYLTVYGGPTQNIKCKELEPYLQKIWDNSDMYNDFMIRIPQTLSGTFSVKHSDYTQYKKFCKENGLEYPKDKLEKKISITQVSVEDVIGEMVVKYNDNEYTNNGESFEVDVSYVNITEIEIVSTKFMVVNSMTKCSVVENSPVSVSKLPIWLDATVIGNKIKLTCNEKNNFGDRLSSFKIENTENTRQYIMVDVKQKSGN